jgi:hypothetical protein
LPGEDQGTSGRIIVALGLVYFRLAAATLTLSTGIAYAAAFAVVDVFPLRIAIDVEMFSTIDRAFQTQCLVGKRL